MGHLPSSLGIVICKSVPAIERICHPPVGSRPSLSRRGSKTRQSAVIGPSSKHKGEDRCHEVALMIARHHSHLQHLGAVRKCHVGKCLVHNVCKRGVVIGVSKKSLHTWRCSACATGSMCVSGHPRGTVSWRSHKSREPLRRRRCDTRGDDTGSTLSISRFFV